MSDEALRPMSFSVEVPEEETPVDKVAERESQEYKSLSIHPGWIRIRGDLLQTITNYRQLRGVDVSGLTKEQVGERFLVSNMVADELEAIVKKVDLHNESAPEPKPRKA